MAPAQIASFAPYAGEAPPKPPRTDRIVLSSLKKKNEQKSAVAEGKENNLQTKAEKTSPDESLKTTDTEVCKHMKQSAWFPNDKT